MRQLISTLMLFATLATWSHASTLSDVKILEASEEIKQLAQEMAKDYMLLYTNKQKKEYYNKTIQKLDHIEEGIRSIAFSTKQPKIKRILDFLSYEKGQLTSKIKKDPSTASASAILDSSDAITEGADKIIELTKYHASFEEQMFMSCKKIIYLIEKISKYYIVLGSNIDKTTIFDKMDHAIAQIDTELTKIKQYDYINQPEHFSSEKKDLFDLWSFNKKYYQKAKSTHIPYVLLISGKGMENIINDISVYHSKN